MSKRFLTKLAGLVLIASVLTGLCSCSSSSGKGDVVVGITQEPSSFDPHTAVAAGDKEILFNVYEGLYKFDSDGNLNPCLATDVEISDDSMTYTFTIRDGVKFHNGETMDADDVVFSLNRAAGLLEYQAGDAPVAELSSIELVKKDDEGRVVVALAYSDSELLNYFTVGIIPAEYELTETAPVGTGPFKFDHYTAGQEVVLTRNDDYWNENAAYLNSVTFKICADMDAGLLELQSGTIDIFPYLDETHASQLDPEMYNIVSNSSNMVQVFALNNVAEPLDDVRVREAINLAVDRDAINQIIFAGYSRVLVTAMSPAMGEYYNSDLDGTIPLDRERAKELLAEAGYPDGFELEITVPSNYLLHVNTAIEIAAELAEIGIDCNIVQVDWSTWLEQVYSNRQYQSTVIAITSNYAAYDVLKRYQSDASGNFINYSNDTVDRLMLEIPTSTDHDEKVALYKEVQALILEDYASCYIEDPQTLTAVSTKYTGYTVYPMYVQDMSTVKLAE